MASNAGGTTRLAVLIDADNLPPGVLDEAMNAAKRHGNIIVACAYRHWTEATRKGWIAGFQKHGIRPVDQAPGPNATDIALAIDAVDLLRERGLDAVCVVSSDRDFAPLAARLRRSRLTAVLMADPGKVKKDYLELWDEFVPLTIGPTKPAKKGAPSAAPKIAAAPFPPAPPVPRALTEAVLRRLGVVKKDASGWARLNEVGKEIDPNLKKPSLRKALIGTAFEIDDRPFDGKGLPTACIRRKP